MMPSGHGAIDPRLAGTFLHGDRLPRSIVIGRFLEAAGHGVDSFRDPQALLR
jgi:hypothetical protein